MACFLSIDQSTSATKALLLDRDGRRLDRESREHAQHYPQAGFVEQDAEEIYGNTVAVCEAVMKRREPGTQPEFVSISNQRETIVVFDRDTGKPLHPAIVWQCRRGTDACEERKARGAEAQVHEKTGLTLDPYFSASKLHALLKAHPELLEKMKAGAALIGTIDTFLIYRLTGGRVFATDHTNACRTLLYNIHNCAWDASLCELWEVPERALPEIRDCSGEFGTIADIPSLGGIPLRGVMGDSHASLFAQKCFSRGMTKVTLGTGSSILMNIGEKPLLSDAGVLTTLAWVHDGKPTYAFEGIIVSAASSLTWLRDQLGLLENVADAEAMANALSGNGGVYLVPAFTGLGLPYWQPRARALISGLSSQSDRRHLVRAALEAIAYQLRDAFAAMSGIGGLSVKSVHADGGPTANALLMQFIADLTRIPVHVSTNPDGSPLGAALMGMLGAGVIASPAALGRDPDDAPVYAPQMEEEAAEALHAGWRHAVRQTILNNET